MKKWILSLGSVLLLAAVGVGYMSATSSSSDSPSSGEQAVDFERYEPDKQPSAEADEKTPEEDDDSKPQKTAEADESDQTESPGSADKSGDQGESVTETDIRVLGVERTDKSNERQGETPGTKSSKAAAQKAMLEDLENIQLQQKNPVPKSLQDLPTDIDPDELPTPKGDDTNAENSN